MVQRSFKFPDGTEECFSVTALHRYAFPIKCTDVIFGDDKETVQEIRAEYDPSKKSKPKVSSKVT